MHTSDRSASLSGTLLRVLRARVVLLMVVATALAAWSGAGGFLRAPDDVADSGRAWTDELAARYPGCLSEDAWRQRHSAPGHRSQVTPPSRFVVLRGDGSPATMRADEVRRRATSPQRQDDVWVVGWCA